MSREVAAVGGQFALDPHVMLDDCQIQMSSDNVFRFCAQNGMPSISSDDAERVCLRTAAEIEAERLAAKKTTKTK